MLLAAVTLACVGFPAARVLIDLVRGIRSTGAGAVPPVDWPLLARSLVAAGGVAALATVLALPAAWTTRGWGARWSALLALPMLLPAYLAYSALNLLRAPGSALGDWLLAGPLDEPNLRPVVAARVFAVLGLALWAWPLALLVLSPRLRRIDRGVLESLRLEPLTAWGRGAVLAQMTAGPMLAAFLLTLLVMLGSAVPFHLAQLDTYSVRLWRALDESPPGEQWRAWAAAWPLVLVAAATAMGVVRVLPTAPIDSAQEPGGPEGPRWPGLAAAVAVWGLSVLLPLALFARGVGSVTTLTTFWRSRKDPMVGSAVTSAMVLGASAVVAVATSAALSGGAAARRVAVACIAVLLVAGLVPGVLVGSATAGAWNAHDWSYRLAETPWIVVAAHVARYGYLAALLGWWMHRSTPRDERELRLLDGAERGRPWWRAAGLPQLALLLGGCLAAAVLSFHEIEASVFVEPPGHGRFSQVVLELLHYERRGDLAAAVVTVTGAGLVVALAAWIAGRRGTR